LQELVCVLLLSLVDHLLSPAFPARAERLCITETTFTQMQLSKKSFDFVLPWLTRAFYHSPLPQQLTAIDARSMNIVPSNHNAFQGQKK
jgi:hypothetical protein